MQKYLTKLVDAFRLKHVEAEIDLLNMALWELYDRFKVLDSCFTDLTAFQPYHFQLARHLTLHLGECLLATRP